ncbi:hypothetical protein B0H14DRAFT_2578327 [Mycena olivaceomarginata]|nr:hypothetical protein B0H14DRAFT_2578327 [Mycena olivaceomarginata]
MAPSFSKLDGNIRPHARRNAVDNKSFLWNTWCGSTRGSIETFNECTSRFGPGPVDLRLELKPGPAVPGKVSTPALLELVNTVSEQCATLKLFMMDDIDMADIISTVHSNHFPRLSNLSITVLTFAVPWTTPESFGLLTTLVLNYLVTPDSPTVGEFDALFNAASNLERLSIKAVAASGTGATSHPITMSKLHTIHYCPVGHRDLGSLISRVDCPEPDASGARDVEHVRFRDFGTVPKDVPFGNEISPSAVLNLRPSRLDQSADCSHWLPTSTSPLPLCSWYRWQTILCLYGLIGTASDRGTGAGGTDKMIDRIAIERLKVYCPGEAFTSQSIMTNIKKYIPTVVINAHREPKWHSTVFVSE